MLEKKKINFSKLLWVILTFCLWIIFSFIMLKGYNDEWKLAMEQPVIISQVNGMRGTGNTRLFMLENEQILEQDIHIEEGEVEGFSLFLRSKVLVEQGKVNIKLVDKLDDYVIGEWEYDLSQMTEDGFCDFNLEHSLSVEADNHFYIRMTPYDIGKKKPVMELDYVDPLENSELEVNEESTGGLFAYRTFRGNHEDLKYLALFIYLLMSSALFVICVMCIRKVNIEKIFIVIVLIIGGVYMFVIPPHAVPDEPSHFVTAYTQSSILLGKQAYDSEGNIRVEHKTLWGAENKIPNRDSYVKYFNGMLGQSEDINEEMISTRTPLGMLHPGYLPQVMGITLARIVGMNSEQILLMGRLFALLWYCFIMYWAVRLMPFGKSALMIMGLFPMTMQQVVSYNYDSVLIGACFLMIAYLLYLIYEAGGVHSADIIILSLLIITIASIKFVYLPILGIAILIPQEKFGGVKKKIACGVALVMLGIIVICVTEMSSLISMTTVQNAVDSGAVEKITIGYCIDYPGHILRILLTTIRTQILSYLYEMVASPLGWLEIYLPHRLCRGMMLVLLIGMLSDDDASQEVKWKVKIYIMAIIAGISLLILMALLFDGACNNINSIIVEGVQGRYFLPILPLGVLIIKNNYLKIKARIDNYLVLSMVFLQCIAVYCISIVVISR